MAKPPSFNDLMRSQNKTFSRAAVSFGGSTGSSAGNRTPTNRNVYTFQGASIGEYTDNITSFANANYFNINTFQDALDGEYTDNIRSI